MTKQKLPFQQITIIGVGLIGGSLALAIKNRYPTIRIVGFDKPSILKRAIERKAIDVPAKTIISSVKSSQLIIIATPVKIIKNILADISKYCSKNTIITDTGSVKEEIVEYAHKFFPYGNFIGGHPMTGSEFSGIDAAHPLLFQNAIYILTPTKKTNKKLLNKLSKFFNSLDARIFMMDSSIHDSVVAAVSHLPQLAAVGLMNSVGKHHSTAPAYLALAAGGFRDMTRIASSHFSMWNDIITINKKEVIKALNIYISQLKKISDIIKKNPAKLMDEFETSRALRSKIPKSMKGYLTPLIDLSVFVEDKPGELARLTAEIAKNKINIKDIELLKVREGRGGTFRLSFENKLIANKAAQILKKANFDVSSR